MPAAIVAAAGVVGALGAIAFAARAAGSDAGSPLAAPGDWRAALLVAVPAAFALYLIGIALARQGGLSPRVALGLAAVVQLTPLLAPLLLSTDAHVYWAFGADEAHGRSPYLEQPFPSPYGPLFTLLSEPIAALTPGQESGALVFRVIAVAAILVSLLFVGRLSARPAFAIAFLGWNPLVALHFAGGGHNDALMMVLVLAALWLMQRGRETAAGSAWAAAVCVKWVPAAFLVLVLLHRRRIGSRLAAGFLACGAVLAVAATARYGTTWLDALHETEETARRSGSLGLTGWLRSAGLGARGRLAVEGLLQLGLGLGAVIAALRGTLRLGLFAGLLALFQGWLNPWYALWGIALSAADDDDRAGRLLAVALTALLLRDVAPW